MLSRIITKLTPRFGNTAHSVSLLRDAEKQAYANLVESDAKVDYKVYPLLPHQDPSSPEYVECELDEYHDRAEVEEYNKVIADFQQSLKVQREVWDALANLDRPYKRGIPGIDTNLSPNGPTKPELADLGFERRDPEGEIEWTFQNEDRWIANTVWHQRPFFKHVAEWEKERLHRPVTKDYNHGKGYKYDVGFKPEEKYEYVADRLGHPEFVGTPLERLLKLEKDLYHPTFIDQPFVKMPTQYPSPSLNFEQGEVLYENTRVLEWIRAAQVGNVGFLAYFGIFIPLNMAFKTNLVVDKADELWLGQQHFWNPTAVDAARLFTPISTLGVYYILYSSMRVITEFGGQYAVKVSYSKDKELLFVKRVNNFGLLEEDVYETAHLEILPPRQRSGAQDLSSQDEDGLWRVTCLNSKRNILLYNNSAYWNRKLKDGFLANHLNFWDKSYYGYNRQEQAEREAKRREDLKSSMEQEALPAQ